MDESWAQGYGFRMGKGTLMKNGVSSPASSAASIFAVLAQYEAPLGEMPWNLVPGGSTVNSLVGDLEIDQLPSW
jgi:hypothetical protein